MPPEHLFVNDEFVLTTSHGLHEISKPKVSKFCKLSGFNFRQVFQKALETSFSVVRSPVAEHVKGPRIDENGTGIIDTGASKTVIGEKRVRSLLATLQPSHQKQIRWQKSETVFRFGNNGTLKSLGAVFVPFGKRWLRIEVVQGWTPFLISNAFLSALEADLQISRSILKVSRWGVEVKLCRNEKGLFTVSLTELIDAAHEIEGKPSTEEVITMACNDQPKQNSGVYWSHKHKQQHDAAAADVAQPQPEQDSRPVSHLVSRQSEPAHGAPEGDDDELRVQAIHRRYESKPRRTTGSDGGSQSELRPRADCEEPQTSRSEHSHGMGDYCSPGGQMEGSHLRGSLCPRSQVRELHGCQHKVGITVGSEFSSVCSTATSAGSRGQREEDDDGTGDGTSSPTSGGCFISDGSQAQTSRVGGDFANELIGNGQTESEQSRNTQEGNGGHGRDSGYGARDRSGDQGREDASSCSPSARDGSDQEGVGQGVRELEKNAKGQNSDFKLTANLCQQIEYAQLTIEKELEKLKSVWNVNNSNGSKSAWKLDLLEIYCERDSQLTEQAQRLGLKARRFTFQDGDLSTSEGRAKLWKVILEEKPREIWVAPDCKYWGNFQQEKHGPKLQHSKQNPHR